MGVVAYTPSTDANGKSSLESDVWTPDTLVKKDIIFDALKSGTFEGKAYNFNGDIFTLLGRSQDTLPSQQCVEVVPPSSTSGGSTTSGKTTTQGSTTASPQGSTTNTQNFEDSSATSVFVSFGLLATVLAICF
jgi:hypothetical protein